MVDNPNFGSKSGWVGEMWFEKWSGPQKKVVGATNRGRRVVRSSKKWFNIGPVREKWLEKWFAPQQMVRKVVRDTKSGWEKWLGH